jgi:hypothetical protein
MADFEHVGPIDPTKKTSEVRSSVGGTIYLGNVEGQPVRGAQCFYNGTAYSSGARVCQSGTIMVCNQWGSWDFTYESCPTE